MRKIDTKLCIETLLTFKDMLINSTTLNEKEFEVIKSKLDSFIDEISLDDNSNHKEFIDLYEIYTLVEGAKDC